MSNSLRAVGSVLHAVFNILVLPVDSHRFPDSAPLVVLSVFLCVNLIGTLSILPLFSIFKNDRTALSINGFALLLFSGLLLFNGWCVFSAAMAQ